MDPKKVKLIEGIGTCILIAILALILSKALNKVSDNRQDQLALWGNSSVVTGTAKKVGDYTSAIEKMSGKSFYNVEMSYTVDGKDYKNNYKFDTAVFDRLDGDPQDGEAELDVHYDPDNPALIAAEGMAIGDKIVGQD